VIEAVTGILENSKQELGIFVDGFNDELPMEIRRQLG
jgi:hypothetical protein